jgi:hypothetical protein
MECNGTDLLYFAMSLDCQLPVLYYRKANYCTIYEVITVLQTYVDYCTAELSRLCNKTGASIMLATVL